MFPRAWHLVLACFLCAAFPAAQQPQTISRPEDLLARGETALRQGRYAEAKALFEEAEKTPGVNVAEVNAGLGITELQLGHYEAARRREARVLSLVSKPREMAEAHDLTGTAWLRESFGTPAELKAEKLKKAEQEFRQSVALDPLFDSAFFHLGTVLSQEGRATDAAAAFKESIEAASKNPESEANLPLRRQGRAPLFGVTDSAGRTVSLEGLRGRFVLLDFWATWCPPCIRALPIMRQLAVFFPPERFTVISVDEDFDNRGAWSRFIEGQNMSWNQIWDENSNIYYRLGEFGFASRPQMVIPKYVLIDPEGFVLHVYSGTDRVGVIAGEIVRTVNGRSP